MNLFSKDSDKKKNVQDAQVVEAPAIHKDTAALEALRAQIEKYRDDFKKQIAQTKETIEQRDAELKNLHIRLQKLQGAVEASDLYLKPATPASK
jgi:septal ring factor EnvC (AmiA/AmiB activator)